MTKRQLHQLNKELKVVGRMIKIAIRTRDENISALDKYIEFLRWRHDKLTRRMLRDN